MPRFHSDVLLSRRRCIGPHLLRPHWCRSLTQPSGLADQQPQRLRCRLHLERVLVGVHPLGELNAKALDALGHQLLRHLGRAALTRIIPIKRNQHTLYAMALEGIHMLLREALNAVGRRHVAVPRAPERQRIQQRLAQDDFLRSQRRHVEHAAAASFPRWQVQVLRRASPQVVQQLPAIHLHHVARLIEHRHNQRPVEVLMTTLPVQAYTHQPLPDLGPILACFRRQPKPQAAVRQAQPEVLNQLGMIQAP